MTKKSSVATEEKILQSTNKTYLDTITLLVVFSILSIDFFPAFGSLEIIAPQYLYLSIVNALVGFFIFKQPELLPEEYLRKIKKSNLAKSYTAFLFLCLITVFTAQNTSLAVVSFTQILVVFCLFINLSILLYRRLYLIYTISFLIGISMFIRTYMDYTTFISLAKSSNLVVAFNQIKGNTGNINIHAASLTGKIPFLLLGIIHFSKWKKWFLSLTLLMVTILILLIASRAAYIALFLILLVFIAATLKIKWHPKPIKSILPAIILPVVLAFFIANFIFKKAENTERFQSVTERVMQIIPTKTEDASINIRLKYWQNAFEIAQSNPVFGVGLGNWKIASIPYEKKISNGLLLSNHAHNDFLEIAAEAGFVTLLAYLLIFVFALLYNLQNCSSKKEPQTRIIALIALLLMLSYGIDALFNFPLYRATVQINFCLFLVLTVLNGCFTQSNPTATNSNSKYILIVVFLSSITAYFSYTTFKAYQFENNMLLDQAKGEANYSYTYSKIVQQIPKFPNVATNSEPYIELAGIYAVKEKKYSQALHHFDQSNTINPHTGRAQWYQYRIYKELGQLDSAHYYAKKAFAIRPRNEDYYLAMLTMDAYKKDTTAILKNHSEFIKYIQQPNIWIQTSSALAQSRYPNDKIIKFINSAITLFPNDSSLQNRKKSFEKDAIFAKKQQLKESKNTAKATNLILATQYSLKKQYHKALVYYKKAALDYPKNSIITQNIGICYFKINQFKSAIIYLEKTLNSPILIDGKTEYLLGAAYLNTNNKQKGCQNLLAAKNKNHPDASKLLAQYCN
ncbi:O-antigen ligase family protein [Flavobacterium crassostreae]|uniref:O-antigen ligase-related domain-containing protein n=1 Tax=Flavobacterium crassostreae TaxID=1763534 RepID=A0A1B9E9G1_9FLAO|nr:O-antigen ligase family protein [Flavobacterium crassostreae]OCB78572.1 hypothetical protein LPBF_00820 [Flavobacterium crassostreae]